MKVAEASVRTLRKPKAALRVGKNLRKRWPGVPIINTQRMSA